MDMKRLDDQYAVSPQVHPAELDGIPALGIKSVLFHRPDDEGDDQPTFEAVAAAARKQAPIVAANLLADMAGKGAASHYDGYGSCPLTVERGKVVLAEFGYGGTLLPLFAPWLLNGKRPGSAAWFLEERLLPIYRDAMLKGREWLARPAPVGSTHSC